MNANLSFEGELGANKRGERAPRHCETDAYDVVNQSPKSFHLPSPSFLNQWVTYLKLHLTITTEF